MTVFLLGQTCLSQTKNEFLRKISVNVYGYEPVYYTERCCAVTMQFLGSIFQKSSALALVDPIFALYESQYPSVCDGLSALYPELKLACFFYMLYEKAIAFVDQINVINNNQQYLIAFNTAKLQYKSVHAIECFYGLKK